MFLFLVPSVRDRRQNRNSLLSDERTQSDSSVTVGLAAVTTSDWKFGVGIGTLCFSLPDCCPDRERLVLFPTQTEHHAIIVSTAIGRGAVKLATPSGQFADGRRTIGPGKPVQDRFGFGGDINFVDRAKIIGIAAGARRAVQRILQEKDIALGVCAIGSAGKTVEWGQGPVGRQAEDGAGTVRSAILRRTVKRA